MVCVKGPTVAATITVTGLIAGAVKLGALAITAGIAGTTLAAVGFAVAGVAVVALATWAIYLGVRASRHRKNITACQFIYTFLVHPFKAISQLFKKCCCRKKENQLEVNQHNDGYTHFSDGEDDINVPN